MRSTRPDSMVGQYARAGVCVCARAWGGVCVYVCVGSRERIAGIATWYHAVRTVDHAMSVGLMCKHAVLDRGCRDATYYRECVLRLAGLACHRWYVIRRQLTVNAAGHFPHTRALRSVLCLAWSVNSW